MGRKIVPIYKTEDEGEKREFQETVEEMNFEKAINICYKASDEKGHFAKIQFNAPRYYLIPLERILANIPGLAPSDAHRTIYILGSQVVNKALKEKGKIGGELDDMLTWVKNFEYKYKVETIYSSWAKIVENFDEYLNQFKGNRERLMYEIKRVKEDLNTISDKHWREELSKKLKHKIKEYLDSNYIKNGNNEE